MIPEVHVEPRVVKTPEGQVSLWVPDARLVLSRVEGRMALVHARALMQEVDAMLREHAGSAVAIHDFIGVESYEIAVHAQMSAWSVSVMRSMRRVVVGVASPLVSLAVRTVNLAAGGRFEVVDTRDALLEAVHVELVGTRKVG